MAWQEPIFVLVEWGRQLRSKRNNDLDHAEWIPNLRCESKFWKEKNNHGFIHLMSFPGSNVAKIWWKVGGKYRNGYGKVTGRKSKRK